MGTAVIITSFKGGVGKTTVSAAIGYSLSKLNKKILAIDMDFGTRGLDIALGRENIVSPTVLDLLLNEASLDEGLIECNENMSFISAPLVYDKQKADALGVDDFERLVLLLKERFDFILFDMPAGGGEFFTRITAAPSVKSAIVVSTDTPNALRAAENTVCRLKNNGVSDIRLLINGYDISSPDKNNTGIMDMINYTSAPIIGIVPFDPYVSVAVKNGAPFSACKKSLAKTASQNIANRMCLIKTPLLKGYMNKRQRLKFY